MRSRAILFLFAVIMNVGNQLGGSALQADELPASIIDSLNSLKRSFRGMDGFLSTMEKEIKRNRKPIKQILEYAKSSEENANKLFNHLLSSLNAFAERFKPGTKIDEELLKQRYFVVGTQPWFGLSIEAYLLMEIVKLRRSPLLTARALATLVDVVRAGSYLAEEMRMYQSPKSRKEILSQRKRGLLMGTTWGAEIAWVCDNFMAEQYESHEPYLPEKANELTKDYVKWRAGKVGPYFSNDYQNQIIKYAEKLADVILQTKPAQ